MYIQSNAHLRRQCFVSQSTTRNSLPESWFRDEQIKKPYMSSFFFVSVQYLGAWLITSAIDLQQFI